MMKTKVLVLNPPSPDSSYVNRDLMGGMGVYNKFGRKFLAKTIGQIKGVSVRIPVLQLVYCATLLSEEPIFELKVLDAANEGKTLAQVLPEIKKFNPEFVVMSISTGCFSFERDVVAKAIKSECSNAKIVTVGDLITEAPELLLPPLDVGIMGEAEKNILQICKGLPFDEIEGVVFRENGVIRKTSVGSRLSPEELDLLPLPKWNLFPYQNYSYFPMLDVMPIATVLASRGCPYNCGYCPYTRNQGLQWRARSAEKVFEELKNNVEKYGFRGVVFRDPLFSLNLKRVEKLCNLIIDSGLKLDFVIETRPELLNKETLSLLKKAGCSAINFGIEDINPDILRNINRKPVDLGIIEEVIQYAESVGIRTSCFFILGLPGSTRKTVDETIAFSKKLFPSQVEYKIATPYPGTQLYEMAKENKWLVSEGFDDMGGYNSVMQISEELPPDYLEQRASVAFNGFYFSFRYVWREVKRGRIVSDALKFGKAVSSVLQI